jgi:hypothetical protein
VAITTSIEEGLFQCSEFLETGNTSMLVYHLGVSSGDVGSDVLVAETALNAVMCQQLRPGVQRTKV